MSMPAWVPPPESVKAAWQWRNMSSLQAGLVCLQGEIRAPARPGGGRRTPLHASDSSGWAPPAMGRLWKALLPPSILAGVGILLAMQSEWTGRANVKIGRPERNDGL